MLVNIYIGMDVCFLINEVLILNSFGLLAIVIHAWQFFEDWFHRKFLILDFKGEVSGGQKDGGWL